MPGRNTQEPDMKRCIASGKTEIGRPQWGFHSAKKGFRPLLSRPTRSVNPMLLLVIWTEFQRENRPISSFHHLFHPLLHPAASPKYSQRREIACGSTALGDECRDGELAVATPLFHSKN